MEQNKTKKYLAAVSGGPDSMAMLDIYKNEIYAVCHVNYHDRNDTHIDEQIVRKYCEDNNILLYVLDVKKEMYNDIKIKNPQAKYRILRYEFFCDVANKTNIKTIMVGHNFNDFLETAYMQKQKNSTSLFYGIKEHGKYNDLRIWRPLLYYSKSTLKSYCEKHFIDYADDWTNHSDMYRRNIVRKVINNMNRYEINKFANWVSQYNSSNREKYLEVETLFENWKNVKFDAKFFITLNNDYQYHLVYSFLSFYNFKNISANKIHSIIQYINKNKIDEKHFRLEDNIYLGISKDNKIVIIQKAN